MFDYYSNVWFWAHLLIIIVTFLSTYMHFYFLDIGIIWGLTQLRGWGWPGAQSTPAWYKMQLLLSFTCSLHYSHKILSSYKHFYFFDIRVTGPPGRGVGVDQGPNQHLSDIKCNCYCHLHVHYIIFTKFYQVISIFIFLIFGVLCGRVRLGWGPDGGDWTIWYGQIYIYFDSIYPYHYIYGIIFHGWWLSACFFFYFYF